MCGDLRICRGTGGEKHDGRIAAARDMFLAFTKVHMTGAITGAHVCMDARSFWYAPEDSEVTFTGDVFLNQIDAPEGVVIRAKGAQEGEYSLHSGGKLIVTE